MARWIEDGTLPHVAEFVERGASGRLELPEPTTSAAVHNSLAAGDWPSNTGIVGERLHRYDDSFYWYTSGYELPMTDAESLWQAASRSGLTTAALFWPGATPSLSEQIADYTVGYGERIAYSARHDLSFRSAQMWGGAPVSFSPLLESQFQIGDRGALLADVFVLAADGTDNGVVLYDTFLLSTDRSVDGLDVVLTPESGEWASWVFAREQGFGADFAVLSPSIESFTLYQSGIYRLPIDPPDLREDILAVFGFFPAPPDFYALDQGWITEEQFMVMLRRQSDWMMDVTIWVYENYQPDLLLTVQSPLRQAGFEFSLSDQRQSGYSPERAARYLEYVREAERQADAVLGRLEGAVREDLSAGAISMLVVGTGGVAPIHTQVNLNTLLEQDGLLALDRRDFVRAQNSQAVAFSSGGSAWIYINLAGREADGFVRQEDYDALQTRIIMMLNDVTDPATGEPVFQRVLRRDELEALNLDSDYAGDVFVQVASGYHLSDDRGRDLVFEPASFYGQQGFSAELLEMQGFLIVVGGGVPEGILLDTVRLIDIAPTIAALLGFTLDPGIAGRPILDVQGP